MNKKSMSKRKYHDYRILDDMETVLVFTTSGEEFVIDICDLDIIKKTTYCVNRGYLYGGTHNNVHQLHRAIMGFPDRKVVDHKDGNPLNNKRNNLRICSQKRNTQNSRIRINNTSGYKGVSFDARRGKWRAYIAENGKQRWLGYHKTAKLAHEARMRAVTELYGEYAHNDEFKMEE